MTPSPKKDTIYIDVDDDITGIIDRVKTSKNPIVAAVLPKRASVLHSSVNMRLLKRASESSGKKLVLVTSEASVLKLAAATQVHVAKSLTTKPTLPKVPVDEPLEEISTDEVDSEPEIDKSKSVGELSGAKKSSAKAEDDDETIELDNAEDDTNENLESRKKAQKPKRNKKLVVPSFDRFRNRFLLIGGGVLLLLLTFFLGSFVLPRATITVHTELSDLDTEFDFTANVGLKALDEKTKAVPATLKEVKKTLTEKFEATGEKDIGNKATGTMTLKNCSNADGEVVIPSGTAFSNGGFTFHTDEAVSLPVSTFVGGNLACVTPTRTVDVTASSGGDNYNLSSRSYSSGYTGVIATGSAMSGGTTNKIKVVSAEDIENAKQKLMAKNTDAVKDELVKLFEDEKGLGLRETFTANPATVTSAPALDQQAGQATLTIEFSYQMLGVTNSDMSKLLSGIQVKEIDDEIQKVYNNGVSSASIGQLERPDANNAKLHFNGTAKVGPKLDGEAIAREVAGKNGGETKQIIMKRPGIESVDVRYDPFWVLKTPTRVNRIKIVFDEEQ